MSFSTTKSPPIPQSLPGTRNGQPSSPTCSNSLKFFPYNPINFEVDENGAGNITIGPSSYIVHEDINISEGISRMHSPSELSLVTCAIHVSQALRLVPSNSSTLQDVTKCFPQGPHQLGRVMEVLKGDPSNMAATPSAALANHNASTQSESIPMEKRQGACGVWSQVTYPIGDGDPHQNPLHIQVTV